MLTQAEEEIGAESVACYRCGTEAKRCPGGVAHLHRAPVMRHEGCAWNPFRTQRVEQVDARDGRGLISSDDTRVELEGKNPLLQIQAVVAALRSRQGCVLRHWC